MKVKKIVVGIDFGKDTESVLAYSSYFAKTFGASLNLLYVIDYLITPPTYLEPYIKKEKRDAEKKFEVFKKKLTNAEITTDTDVIVGRLQESFAAEVKKVKADMLVLGFITHALRRSSSEKLVKGLKMHMLVVRGEKTENAQIDSLRIKKILCPTDLSQISGKALKIAGELSEIFPSELHVLNVLPDSVMKKVRMSKEGENASQEFQRKAKEQLYSFLAEFSIKEAGTVSEGEPAQKIVSFSREHDIDLIVMGARGLGLIQGMIIGSVTDAVLKSSPCPVLVIH